MIKIEELKVCATINRAASVKKDKKGASYLSCGVVLPITGKNGETNLAGEMSIQKHNGKTCCYLRPESVELTNDGTDAIEGILSFRGKLGKKDVELKEDKNAKIFLVFSAFSVDKTKDVAEFTWVNFLYFDPQDEDFLKPGTYIDAKGPVQFGVYNDTITLDCRVTEVKPWVLEKK